MAKALPEYKHLIICIHQDYLGLGLCPIDVL